MALKPLLDWCGRNDFFIDSRISVCYEEGRGIHVISRNSSIPPNVTLVRIPKRAVLSVKSCALSNYIPFELHGLGAQLGLSFALYSEILQGENSRWYGYLLSLIPPDLPIFWEYDSSAEQHEAVSRPHPDLGDPILLLRGTEVSMLLMQRDDMGHTLLQSIDYYYQNSVVPVLNSPCVRPLLLQEPNSVGFREAFSLVSSRSFLLDVYHGLAMTPIADAFNHVSENHVHIQSEFYVCPHCGSLRECKHDDDSHDHLLEATAEHGDLDLYYEMSSNAEILPNEEVFNTYGERLTNAQLLMQYGFILDPNENDMVHISVPDVVNSLAQPHISWEFPPGWDADVVSPSQSLDTSTLIFALRPLNPDSQFCINSDGKISCQLWRFIVQYLCRKASLASTLDELTATQLKLEAALQELPETSFQDDIDQVANRKLPLTPVISELAQTIIRLCENKKENTGFFRHSEEDLGGILDALPDDKKRERLALSVIISERSILDSCLFGWLDFVDGLLDNGCGDDAM